MTKFNWDRVNMENLAARRNEEHFRKMGEIPYNVPKSPVSKNKRRPLLKNPAAVPPSSSLRRVYCGSPLIPKNRKKYLPSVRSFFNRLLDVLLLRKQPEATDLHVCHKAIREAILSKAKDKKHKSGIMIDVLYTRDNEQLARTISARLQKININCRLVETVHKEPVDFIFGRMTCHSRTPDTLALAGKLVEEFTGTIDLIPEYESLRRKGRVTFTISVCGN